MIRKIILLPLLAFITSAFINPLHAYVILPLDCRSEIEKCIKKDQLKFIFIFSEIDTKDFDKINEIDALWPADKPFPPVYLESEGGRLTPALAIGRILRERNAYVETKNPFIESGENYRHRCYSACAFIAAGATKRQISNIGLHNGYSTINRGKANQQYLPARESSNALIRNYLEEMKMDAQIYAIIRSTPFDGMKYFEFDPSVAGFDQDIVRWGFHQFNNPESAGEAAPIGPASNHPSFYDDKKFAVSEGIHEASVELAYAYASQANGRKPNYPAAMKAMLYAAIMEDVHAQHMMGHLLSTGEWQEKNLKEGKEWFLKAAQNGFPGSQNNIGWAYYKGTGVQKNIPLAVHWITRSADAGEPFAYGSLCEMYGAGNVFPPDKQEAYKWCKLAALEMPFGKARDLAVKILNRYISKMSEDQLSVGKADVESWKPLRQTKFTMQNMED